MKRSVELLDSKGVVRSLAELEAEIIAAAVQHSETLTQVAEQLGISRSTLWRKMREYGITSQEVR